MTEGKNQSRARFGIYFLATFGFASLPMALHLLQRGGSSGAVTFSDFFPSPDWFVYTITIWAATLAELGHETKIGEAHLFIAVCATLVVVLASYQYAQLSSLLEALRLAKQGSGELAVGPNRWFTGWNIVLASISTAFAIILKLTESKRAN